MIRFYLATLVAFCIVPNYIIAQNPDYSFAVRVDSRNATCHDSMDASITIKALEGTVPVVVQWINNTANITGAGIISSLDAPLVFSEALPGQYNIYISNTYGIDTALTVTLVEPEPLEFEFTSAGETCFGASDARIEITGISGGAPPYYATAANLPAANNIWDHLSNGTFFVEVEDAAGCALKKAAILPAGLEFDFELGDLPAFFTGDTLTGAFTAGRPLSAVEWSPREAAQMNVDGSYQIFTANSTDVIVTVTDLNGCKSEDNWLVEVQRRRSYFAPNVFTPEQGEAENNVFNLFFNGGIAHIESLSVGDRDGRLWFRCTNVAPQSSEAAWDGTANGKKAPAGVYFWAARLRYTDGRTDTVYGDVTVVR